jgi:hypothetical protein
MATTKESWGIFDREFKLPLLHAGLLLLAVLAVFTAIFGHWTATSPWGFPRFVAGVVVLLYLPGRLWLKRADLGLRPVEDFTLSLMLGTATSSFLYWILGYLELSQFFILWPPAAFLAWLYSWTRDRNWKRHSSVLSFNFSHLLLLLLFFMSLVPLFLLPTYYANFDLTSEGHLAIWPIADTFLHVAISQELTHSIPPQVPFFAGKPLSYHYVLDLLPAMFSRTLRVDILDSSVRFLPTYFWLSTILGVFCLSRLLIRSAYGAVLCAFLVLFGEDFSYILGILSNSKACWAAGFFSVPTILSLYTFNPMLPALGLLCGALFCLAKYCEDGKKIWLFSTAVLVAFLTECKVFAAAHLLFAWAIAAFSYYLFFRDGRMLKGLAVTFTFVLPVLTLIWFSNSMGAKQTVQFFSPQQIANLMHPLKTAVVSCAGGEGSLSAVTLEKMLQSTPLLVVLYLIGSLGLRGIGLPLIAKAVFFPDRKLPLRFLLAVFVVGGFILALTMKVTPADLPNSYNNAVWFYVQGKFLMWLFVVELVLSVFGNRNRILKVVAAIIVIVFSVPSTGQAIVAMKSQYRTVWKYDRNERDLVDFLHEACSDGEVVLVPKKYTKGKRLPVSVLTPCRTPYEDLFLPYLVPVAEIQRRERDLKAFWKSVSNNIPRKEVIERYGVDYLVTSRRKMTASSESSRERSLNESGLVRLYENDDFQVYKRVGPDS